MLELLADNSFIVFYLSFTAETDRNALGEKKKSCDRPDIKMYRVTSCALNQQHKGHNEL